MRASGGWFPSAGVDPQASGQQLAPDTHVKLDGHNEALEV